MTLTTTSLTTTSATGPFVLVGSENGITVIPTQTPLARLNYFDGKFLRAEDLTAEQRYLRSLVELSNRAGGHGIAHGFDVIQRALGELEIGPGLAIDPEGRVLLLPAATTVGLTNLIEKTRQTVSLRSTMAGFKAAAFGDCIAVKETPPTQVLDSGDLYLITIAHAEALCGEEDVYGKLCEEACVTSTDRPFRIEGIVLRARPLVLSVPLPTSGIGLGLKHWRSRVASAYYDDERRRVANLISKAGLESDVWCHGAVPETGSEVPIAVVGRVGTGIQFLDLWTVRRERIDTPARRYWQWRMAMRPWDVFLAQVLQFQCQLNSALSQVPTTPNPDDPCQEAQALVEEANVHLQAFKTFYAETTQRLMRSKSLRERALFEGTLNQASLTQLDQFATRLAKASEAFKALPADRLLINGGIIELPSAGYLPVIPGTSLTVNEQVRRLMGEGVDLRFCIVRPDYVAHALEEAQHLERISLTAGIDNPNQKQEVDVLVPYGQIAPDRIEQGRFYEMRLNLNVDNLLILATAFAALRVVGGKAAGTDAAGATGSARDSISEAQLKAVRRYLELLAKKADGALVFKYETGAARSEESPQGALSFCYAGMTPTFEWAGSITDRATDAANKLAIDARSSIWVALDLGRDPTEMAVGDSTSAKADCYVLLSMTARLDAANRGRSGESLIQFSFAGDLQVVDVDTRMGTVEVREVKAVLTGQLTVQSAHASEAGGLDRDVASLHLTESVTLIRTEDTYGPTVTIEVPEPSILQPLIAGLVMKRNWESAGQAGVKASINFRSLAASQELNPKSRYSFSSGMSLGMSAREAAFRSALGDVFVRSDLVPRQAFRAWQSIKPEVLEPTHPAHESAIRAVRTIGSALGSPAFADLAAKRLFPAPTQTSSGLNVLATLDWVLFHRRREKQCALATPAPQVQTRSYALYAVQLSDNLTFANLVKAMTSGGTDLERFKPDFVQMVEFGAGIHAVVTPHAIVQAGWRNDVGSDAGEIEGGIIASRGLAASEGARLAEDRLEALVEVVATVTPPVVQPTYVVRERLPDGFAEAGKDGMIVIALRPVEGACHDVYAFMGNVDQFEDFKRMARTEEEGLPAALKQHGERLVKVQVPFDQAGGTLDPMGKRDLLNAFKAEWTRGEWVGYVASEGDVANGTKESEQVLAVLDVRARLGSVTPGIGFSVATGCHGITVVRVAEAEVGVACHEMIAFVLRDNDVAFLEFMKLLETVGPRAALEDSSYRENILGRRTAFFDRAGGTLRAESKAELETWAQSVGLPREARTLVLSESETTTAGTEVIGMLTALGAGTVPVTVTADDRITEVSDCHALTLVRVTGPSSNPQRTARVVLVPRDANNNVMTDSVVSSWTPLTFDAGGTLATSLLGSDVDRQYKSRMADGQAAVTLVNAEGDSEEAQNRLREAVAGLEAIGIRVTGSDVKTLDEQSDLVRRFQTLGTPVDELVLLSYRHQA